MGRADPHMTGGWLPPLLDVARIYLEPAVEEHARGAGDPRPISRGRARAGRFHWRIPELREGDPGDFLAAKRQALVLGVKKGLTFRPNGRSADFIAPSSSNGCAMACAYCYVARRKGMRTRSASSSTSRRSWPPPPATPARQGPKTVPNQVDPRAWVYDLGENGDLSVDARSRTTSADLVALFRTLPDAKGSFATKVGEPGLCWLRPAGAARASACRSCRPPWRSCWTCAPPPWRSASPPSRSLPPRRLRGAPELLPRRAA
jgi:hypothetical protein